MQNRMMRFEAEYLTAALHRTASNLLGKAGRLPPTAGSSTGESLMFVPREKQLFSRECCHSWQRVLLLWALLLCAAAQAAQHPVPLGKNPTSKECLTCHADKTRGKYVHSAMAMGCTTCHEVTSARGVTLVSLVSPADELCFTCHAKSTDKHLHAPYAQGNCIVCHSPHSSNWPDQLLAAPQNICMGCHVRERLKVNFRRGTATVPWGVTLTLDQLKGWHYLRLNKALTANHPIEGHPVTGPNRALGAGAPAITCLSCHEPHYSNHANLLPPKFSNTTELCDSCHKYPGP